MCFKRKTNVSQFCLQALCNVTLFIFSKKQVTFFGHPLNVSHSFGTLSCSGVCRQNTKKVIISKKL